MYDTRNKTNLAALRAVVVDMIALMNQSPLGGHLVREAKFDIDPALLRILAGIERFGPIGVVELAEHAGRDHTTVSRQVAKLEDLGLIARRVSPTDRRITDVLITAKGRRTADALRAAQERVVAPIIDKWSDKELAELTRLMRKLVTDLTELRDSPGPR